MVEQRSLCSLTGRLAGNRSGETWAKELCRFPHPQQVTRDGGTGLAKGVGRVNQERRTQGQPCIADQEDHFHTLREARRALRQVQQRVCCAIDVAAGARHREQQKARRTGRRQETAAATVRAERCADAAVEAGMAVENAWATITDALQLFTPAEELNSRTRAKAINAAALPVLGDPARAKTRRALARPRLLTFLDQAHARLVATPLSAAVRDAAVQAEGLRQRPEGLCGVLLATSVVLALSGAEEAQAVEQAQGVLRDVWRASSLVECLNSVARMKQSRHRWMTEGLLALKRLSRNCRTFRTGRRRKQSPYGLLGWTWRQPIGGSCTGCLQSNSVNNYPRQELRREKVPWGSGALTYPNFLRPTRPDTVIVFVAGFFYRRKSPRILPCT